MWLSWPLKLLGFYLCGQASIITVICVVVIKKTNGKVFFVFDISFLYTFQQNRVCSLLQTSHSLSHQRIVYLNDRLQFVLPTCFLFIWRKNIICVRLIMTIRNKDIILLSAINSNVRITVMTDLSHISYVLGTDHPFFQQHFDFIFPKVMKTFVL